MNNEFAGPIFLALVVIAGSVWDTAPIQHVRADQLRCTNPESDSSVLVEGCKSEAILGRYEIALNRTANTCAWSYQDEASGYTKLHRGIQFVYVDDENWRCDSNDNGWGESALVETIAQIEGKLSHSARWNDRTLPNPTSEFGIARSDGVMGRVKHYARRWSSR